MPHQSSSMTFAMSADGQPVHVGHVANGLACRCSCLGCGGPLMACQGPKRHFHFRHSVAGEGAGCNETALHKMAKLILAEAKRVALPNELLSPMDGYPEAVSFDEVFLEYRLHTDEGTTIVADAYGNGDLPLVIEIRVRHQTGPEKAEALRKIGVAAIEIDLSDALHEAWDWQSLRHAVLEETARRRWIYAPEQESVSPATPLEVNLPVEGCSKWRFAIAGVTVVARRLPHSNIAVWHAPSTRARAVVESACRNRGWWHGGYNNWIVFDRNWPEVLAALQAACRR